MNTVGIELLGAAALLLWGLRMVRTGVSRTFGPRLRQGLAAGTRNRFTAFLAGMGVTLALQSSIATTLMATSFASRGLIASTMTLAIMLGADVGTSVVAQVLSFNVQFLAPLLILVGVSLFMSSERGKRRSIGRSIVGVGLMLLALKLLVGATAPIRESEIFEALVVTLNHAPVLAVAIAACLTLLTASSLAVILLIASLATGSQMEPSLSVALVLGANIGGTFLPVIASHNAGAVARRAPIGNMLLRSTGALLTLPFCAQVGAILNDFVGPDRLAVDAHLAFNVALALVSLPLIGLVARWLDYMLPEPKHEQGGPIYLDPIYLDSPTIALSCAARETLQVGDRVEAMLEASLKALHNDDEKLCAEIARMDDEIDRMHEAIKLYVSRVGREGDLSDGDIRRMGEIMSFTINLEHVGDIIDSTLRDLVAKKIKHQLVFSPDGIEEIDALFERTLQNLRMAQSTFYSRDVKLARRLVIEKVHVRRNERLSAERHLQRLREGKPESVQTSALHLDIVRDLKRINAHIASVAYPLLEKEGALDDSRLKGEDDPVVHLAPAP